MRRFQKERLRQPQLIAKTVYFEDRESVKDLYGDCRQSQALTPLQRFGNALSCRLLYFELGAEFSDLVLLGDSVERLRDFRDG